MNSPAELVDWSWIIVTSAMGHAGVVWASIVVFQMLKENWNAHHRSIDSPSARVIRHNG